MTPLMNALACLLALASARFLWRDKVSMLKESLILLGFLLISCFYTYFAADMSLVQMEHYPFRMLALFLCFSTTELPRKRRRYLVLAQTAWLWVEFFAGISLFYRGLDMPWIRITAIAGIAFGSSFLSRINREMEFCLMVFWIAIWVFF
ncbi:hypothetical protein [Fibrobacter sp.]|uniref:hypothetical protein n=1 Tax=Fibrobacter sp. TaxID=35828 RepID=UPI00388E47AA